MKSIDTAIQSAIAGVDVRRPASVQEAANAILSEEISAGAQVAVIDDPTYSLAGQKCRVVGPADKGAGWVNVETANGTVMPVQSSLLITL